MTKDAEKQVSKFYNTVGWKTEDGVTVDARAWEDLRDCAKEYVSKCRLRVLKHIPIRGENMLDMASGPIQYREYLEYSKNFTKRYCVDLSSRALGEAKKKIGDHGVFLCGSFFDIPLEQNVFDCTVSLHTIYHIDKDRQEQAVRKLVAVTKPGKPVIIVYSNPRTLISYLIWPLRFVRTLRLSRSKMEGKNGSPDLYFFCHPLAWWERFRDIADVEIMPWRAFAANHQRALVPNNKLGKRILEVLFKLEEKFPGFFVQYFQYPMIKLVKKG